MSDESAFIPGIHNYCDRWCERCPFISRCHVGAAEQEFRNDPAASDVTNAAFWEHLCGILRQTRELLIKHAKDHGIDLNEVMAEAAARPPHEERLTSSEHAEALRQAERYSHAVEAWFERNEEALKSRHEDLVSAARMGLVTVDPMADAKDIQDAVEVIQWYSPQMYVKLRRASQHEDDPAFAKVSQDDCDGSAKVALMGMDRSTAAWGRLYEHLPEAQDSILDILVHLDRLRQTAEGLFPNARAFVRPGFDEPA